MVDFCQGGRKAVFRAVLLVFCFHLVLLTQGHSAASAQNRSALVIGNSGYQTAPLANALNDAKDVAAALSQAGFTVNLITDAGHQEMDEAIRGFGEQLKKRKGVGLFYYAGHGIQIDGSNYLLPVGAKIARERDVKYRSVHLAQLLDEIKLAANGLNIVVVDACRNNPLASSGRSATKGLARVESGGGLFISYSTSPGEVALDGEGRNSPYTKHLVAAMRRPGLTLEQTFKETLKGVYAETGGQQIPWISSSFFGDFSFQPAASSAPSSTQQQIATAPQASTNDDDAKRHLTQDAGQAQTPAMSTLLSPGKTDPGPDKVAEIAGLYRVVGTNPNGTTYRGSVAVMRTDSERTYRFVWWIGRQVFRGEGLRDGRWLRIDWGASSPVIYTIGIDGVLNGVWADGSASEFLSPYALARGDPGASITRTYDVRGRGVKGRPYRGFATIEKAGDGYSVTWKIGKSRYRGRGTLQSGVLIVDWGQKMPAVYAIGKNGVLSGMWAAGKAEERLTPR